MKTGFVMPSGSARQVAEAAQAAEQAGWDGFFVWEPVWGVDAWVSLAAAAMLTHRIRLGTMISPLSRMRPWKLASETATLDHLSNGRVILSVGLGAPDTGFSAFGEATHRKTRAELLDEGLEILTGLWKGQPFAFQGKHYTVQPTDFFPPPPPVQQPRIPIWVVGAWPMAKSMQRVLKYDGILPMQMDPHTRTIQQVTPDSVREIRAFFQAQFGQGESMDIVVEGQTPGNNPDAAARVLHPWAEAGATWWIETMWSMPGTDNTLEMVMKRIAQGPPRLE